jgi:hypothetical protein
MLIFFPKALKLACQINILWSVFMYFVVFSYFLSTFPLQPVEWFTHHYRNKFPFFPFHFWLFYYSCFRRAAHSSLLIRLYVYFFLFPFFNALAAFRNYTFPIPLIFSCVFLFYFDCGPFRREYFTFRSRMQSEHVFRPTTNGKSCHHPKNLITTPPKNNATSPRYIRRC